VLTAAEEQGSMGSKHMVTWLQSEGVEVRGVIAPDMIGYWPQGEDDELDILGDSASQFLVDHMAAVATRLGVAHKTFIQHGFCYGDDHTSFQEAGIPAIAPMDCVEAHNVTGSGEDTPHYHATTDRFDTLHMPKTTKVAGVIVATLAELAEPASK
ncbi:MAG: M28 family peptidase, partial [Deltaproteobacteria bacterium]|nr:M28 family peptidase [Deltaproteobacteria bacterium]